MGLCEDRPARGVGRVRNRRQSERSRGRGVDVLADLLDSLLDLLLDQGRDLRPAARWQVRLSQLLQRGAGCPLGVDRKQLSTWQLETEFDDLAADPDVALQHVWREVSKCLLKYVLARGTPRRTARDHGLQAAEALPCVVLSLVAGHEGHPDPFEQRLGLVEPFAELAGRRLLYLTADGELGTQLGQFAALG